MAFRFQNYFSMFELAALIQSVLAQQPKVVGVDMIFKDMREPYSDSLLMATLSDPRIVGSFIVEKPEYIYSNPYFHLKYQTSGFVNLNFDSGNTVIRSFAGTTLDIQDEPVYSFSSQIAKMAMGEQLWQERNYGQVLLGETPLSYYGNTDKFLTLGFDEFITLDNTELLKDKVVLLGYLGVPTGNPYDVEDKHFTPLNEVTAGKSIPDMYGVLVHANIIHMLLNNKVMTRVANWVVGVLSFLLTFLMIMYFMWEGKKDKISFRTKRKIVQFIFTMVVTFFALWLFKQGVILNAVPLIGLPLLASSYMKYYKHLIEFIQTKRKWKSYVT